MIDRKLFKIPQIPATPKKISPILFFGSATKWVNNLNSDTIDNAANINYDISSESDWSSPLLSAPVYNKLHFTDNFYIDIDNIFTKLQTVVI